MFKVIRKTESARYADLAEATYELTPINQVWNSLVSMWDHCFEFDAAEVFLDALHIVMWGFVPQKEYSDSYLHLIKAVADAVENCDEALKVWSRKKAFVAARDKLFESMTPYTMDFKNRSIIHYYYAEARLMCILEHERQFCTVPRPCAAEFWRGYEEAIIRLIPSAALWTRAQWSNENNIHDALSATYGVDYRENPEDYDSIMLMALRYCCASDPSPETVWYVMNISSLPFSMATALWPTNTQQTVETLFLEAKKEVDASEGNIRPTFDHNRNYIHGMVTIDRETLANSWLFKYVSKWYYDGNLSEACQEEIKKAIFDLSVCS